jgi:hypothetical protein
MEQLRALADGLTVEGEYREWPPTVEETAAFASETALMVTEWDTGGSEITS